MADLTPDQLDALLPAYEPASSPSPLPYGPNPARLALEDGAFLQFRPTLKLVGILPATDPATPASGVVPDGAVRVATPELGRPIAQALADMGLAVAAWHAPSDDDLAAVPAYAVGQLNDLLDLRVLRLILSRWDGYDFAAGSENSQKLGALRDSIEATAKRLEAEVRRKYTPGVLVPDPAIAPGGPGALRRGSIRLGSRHRPAYEEC